MTGDTGPHNNPEILIIGIGDISDPVITCVKESAQPLVKTVYIHKRDQYVDPNCESPCVVSDKIVPGIAETLFTKPPLRNITLQNTGAIIPCGGIVMIVGDPHDQIFFQQVLPIIESARCRKCLTIIFTIDQGVTSKNSSEERNSHMKDLLSAADSVIDVEYERYPKYVSYQSIHQGIPPSHGSLIADVILSWSNLLSGSALIGIEYPDFQKIFYRSGPAVLFFSEGVANGMDWAERMARECWNIRSHEDICKSQGCLVAVVQGPDGELCDAERITEAVCTDLDPTTTIVWGALAVPSMEGRFREYVLIAGIKYRE